jgi:hypothetical protein
MTLAPSPTLYPSAGLYPGSSGGAVDIALPTIEDVALLLSARTRDANGRLTFSFTEDSDPTATVVASIIDDAAEEVATAVPWPLPDAPGENPDAFRKAYRRVVALLAAANVELGYPSSRGTLDRYDRLVARYKDALARLIEAVSEAGEGGGGLSVESPGLGPLYTFSDEPLLPADGW